MQLSQAEGAAADDDAKKPRWLLRKTLESWLRIQVAERKRAIRDRTYAAEMLLLLHFHRWCYSLLPALVDPTELPATHASLRIT
jgi:hypothetical protein